MGFRRRPTTIHACRPLDRLLAMAAAAAAALLCTAASGQSTATDPRLKPVEQGRGDTGPLATSARVAPVDLRLPIGFDRVYRIEGSGRGDRSRDLFARQSGGLTAVFPRSQYVLSGGGLFPEIPAGTTFIIGGLPESLLPGDERSPARRRQAANFIDRSARINLSDEYPSGYAANRSSTGASSPLPGTHAAQTPSNRLASPGQPGWTQGVEPTPEISHADRIRESDIARRASLPRPAPDRPTIFGDESYRRDKITTLLNRASMTGDARTPAGSSQPPPMRNGARPGSTDPARSPASPAR